MGFGRYVLHRLLLVAPTLFGVTLISFTLVYVLPGNPALVKAGSLATPEHVAAIERQMGLDRPIHVQYWRYLTGLLRADLGESSSTGRPVLEDFRQRVPAPLELTLARLLGAAGIGPPPPHAPHAHAGLRRDGSAHPDGARDHARDPRIRLCESRLGGGAVAPACHLRRRPPQRAHPRHHAARRHLRIPDGGQRRSGNGLRVARPRPLRRDLARHQGRRADPVVRAVRGRHVRPRQPDRRLALRAGRPAHPPPLMPWPWRRLARNRLSFAALGAILVVTVAALLAPWLAPYDPDEPDAAAALASISVRHPLGTDLYRRDQLSRLIHAGRVDLLVALSATAIALTLGATLGAAAGYRGGWVDHLVMRGVDAVMAFPAFILALATTAALGHSTG